MKLSLVGFGHVGAERAPEVGRPWVLGGTTSWPAASAPDVGTGRS